MTPFPPFCWEWGYDDDDHRHLPYLPVPFSASTYKEGSNRAGDQEEGFVSRKYSKSGAGYLIQSMVILKTYLWGQGCGYKKKDLKHQEMKCDG